MNTITNLQLCNEIKLLDNKLIKYGISQTTRVEIISEIIIKSINMTGKFLTDNSIITDEEIVTLIKELKI